MRTPTSESIVAVIPKNGHEEVRVSLTEFRGAHFADVRVFSDCGDTPGRKPTPKGVSIGLWLDELLDALTATRRQAERLGLLPALGGAA
jgi:hypothetical protein